MKEYQDDLCDFCGTECYCFTEKDLHMHLDDVPDIGRGASFEEREHSIWLDTFCPEKKCLDKTGTELV